MMQNRTRVFQSTVVAAAWLAFVLTAAPPAITRGADSAFHAVTCPGEYGPHLQGICIDNKDAIFWSFTKSLVKTDHDGGILKRIDVVTHHGDLCFRDGKLYVAVNLGKFNEPPGKADSWVFVYSASDLKELARHKTPEVVHGAGGIAEHNGRFIVVGGLPDDKTENYIYEYDADFRFVKRHTVASGHTLKGIQTATYAHGAWWFGCYGKPRYLLKTDDSFQMLGKYEFDCSLGIVGLREGGFLIGRNVPRANKTCSGRVILADSDPTKGLVLRDPAERQLDERAKKLTP
jgi:hypothetical protein